DHEPRDGRRLPSFWSLMTGHRLVVEAPSTAFGGPLPPRATARGGEISSGALCAVGPSGELVEQQLKSNGGGYPRHSNSGRHVLRCGDDLLVDLPLERHDQLGQAGKPLPPPGGELRRMLAAAGVEHIDLAVVAVESEREPFLLLAA